MHVVMWCDVFVGHYIDGIYFLILVGILEGVGKFIHVRATSHMSQGLWPCKVEKWKTVKISSFGQKMWFEICAMFY